MFHRISDEIDMIKSGVYDKKNNPLKNAPHPVDYISPVKGLKNESSQTWDKPYSIQEAYFPLGWIHKRGKYWPPVGRIDNTLGDRKPIFESFYEDF